MNARWGVVGFVLGCGSGAAGGMGGTGGIGSTSISTGTQLQKTTVASTASTTGTAAPATTTSSSTTAASSSSTGTACLNSMCAKGTQCGPAGGCIPCPDATTCATCYPSEAQILAACQASPMPHVHCTSAHVSDGTVCIPPNQLGAAFPLWCNWDPTESCGIYEMPGDYCRDMSAAGGPKPCPGSRVDPP